VQQLDVVAAAAAAAERDEEQVQQEEDLQEEHDVVTLRLIFEEGGETNRRQIVSVCAGILFTPDINTPRSNSGLGIGAAAASEAILQYYMLERQEMLICLALQQILFQGIVLERSIRLMGPGYIK
jgi:hypothetical protein